MNRNVTEVKKGLTPQGPPRDRGAAEARYNQPGFHGVFNTKSPYFRRFCLEKAAIGRTTSSGRAVHRRRSMALVLLVLLVLVLPGVAAFSLRSFGSTPDQLQPGKRGTGVQHICLDAPPVVFLNHTLGAGATLGVVDQFWVVNGGEVGLAQQGLRLEVSYWFDGEAQPSVVFEPAFANGNGWAAVFQDGQWRNGQQQAGDLGLFSAGPQMGKRPWVAGGTSISYLSNDPLSWPRRLYRAAQPQPLLAARAALATLPLPAPAPTSLSVATRAQTPPQPSPSLPVWCCQRPRGWGWRASSLPNEWRHISSPSWPKFRRGARVSCTW